MSPEGLRDSLAWLRRKRTFWLAEARTHAAVLHRGKLGPFHRDNHRRCMREAIAFARLFNRRVIVLKREVRA